MKAPQMVIESCAASVPGLKALPEFIKANEMYHYATKAVISHHASIVDQIGRSAYSVVVNIAEGYGKSRGCLINSYLIARGEAYETMAGLSLIGKPVDLVIEVIKLIEKQVAFSADREM